MIFRLLARASSSHASARSAEPISSNACITASFAPPCSGPFSAPIAATTAEWRSASVEVTTRAVNVDALKECSAYRTMEMRKTSAATSLGSSPKVIQRKFRGVVEVVARRHHIEAMATPLVVRDDRRHRREQSQRLRAARPHGRRPRHPGRSHRRG